MAKTVMARKSRRETEERDMPPECRDSVDPSTLDKPSRKPRILPAVSDIPWIIRQ
jgi:hypothetical protein